MNCPEKNIWQSLLNRIEDDLKADIVTLNYRQTDVCFFIFLSIDCRKRIGYNQYRCASRVCIIIHLEGEGKL